MTMNANNLGAVVVILEQLDKSWSDGSGGANNQSTKRIGEGIQCIFMGYVASSQFIQ